MYTHIVRSLIQKIARGRVRGGRLRSAACPRLCSNCPSSTPVRNLVAEVFGGPQPNSRLFLRGLTYNEVCHVLVCAAVVRAGVPGYLVLARCGDDGFDASQIAVVPAPTPGLGRFSNDCSHQSKTMRRALPHRNLLERAPRAHHVLDPVSTDAGPQPRRATPILPEVVPSLWANVRLRGGTPHERFVLT